MSISGVGGPSTGAIGADLSGMDLETALMVVQQQRTELLDAELKEQIDAVKQRNELTAKLNDMKAKLNALNKSLEHDAKVDDKVKDNAENRQAAKEYVQLCLSLGVSTSPVDVRNIVENKDGTFSFSLATNKDGDWEARPTKESLERAIGELTSQIDSASNTQQMDMLRLQTMSNKRNEAFDVMTNFVKKMQDSRSAIIGNMR